MIKAAWNGEHACVGLLIKANANVEAVDKQVREGSDGACGREQTQRGRCGKMCSAAQHIISVCVLE